MMTAKKFSLFALCLIMFMVASNAELASAGDLIRCPDFASVYYLAEDDKRYVFPNERIYFSWYTDFNSVEMITCDELSDHMIGGNITYKPGVRLVKIPSVPTVYAVEEGGILRAIQSEQQAIDLYGGNWAALVDDLPESFFPAYEVGDPLQEGEKPEEARSDLKPVEIGAEILTYEAAYDGPLYDTVSHLSGDAPIELYVQNLERNDVRHVIAMFTAEEDEWIDYVYMQEAVDDAPGVFVPFLATGIPADEVELGDEYTQMYENVIDGAATWLGEDFTHGIGEIEQYGWGVPADDEGVTAQFDLAAERGLAVMFHPPEGDMQAVEHVLERYPDTVFLIHMFPEEFDSDRNEIIDLMDRHDNLYYSVNADHMLYDAGDGTGLIYKFEDEDEDDAVDEFSEEFDEEFDELLDDALNRYDSLIEAHPDRVMWGTEGYPIYAYDEEVYDRLIKFTRFFLAEFDEAVARDVGYDNALGVFGVGE